MALRESCTNLESCCQWVIAAKQFRIYCIMHMVLLIIKESPTCNKNWATGQVEIQEKLDAGDDQNFFLLIAHSPIYMMNTFSRADDIFYCDDF